MGFKHIFMVVAENAGVNAAIHIALNKNNLVNFIEVLTPTYN